MLAITLTPGTAGSARLEDIPEPRPGDRDLLVEALALGIVIEASGVASVAIDAMANTGANAITCLTGVSPVGRTVSLDGGGELVRRRLFGLPFLVVLACA